MKIGPVKLQLHAGEVLRLQWPGILDFSPFWTACQIWPELGTKLKLGSFLYWATVYENAENRPNGIVTEVAMWRQIRHFVPKSAALSNETLDATHPVTHSLSVQNFALITRVHIGNAM